MSDGPDVAALVAGALPGLPEDALGRLVAASEVVEVAPGGRVIHEGEAADALFVVAGGFVQLSLHQRQRDLPVATVGTGELLGWSWLVPPHRWDFDASSTDGATLVRMPAAELRSVMDDDPATAAVLATTVAAVVSRRLRDTRIQLLDLYARTAGESP